MRALVTGGTGFIGANLVAGLNQAGVAARVLCRPSSSHRALEGLTYETVYGDILGPTVDLVEAMADCDWVFHAAAVADYWRQDADWIYKVNVEGTRRVVAAAQRAGVRRLVQVSSVTALGVPEPGRLLTESSRFNLSPNDNPYGHSKYLAEEVVKEGVAGGQDAVIVNLPIIIGPRDVNEISGSMVTEAARGTRLPIYPPGGTNYLHVTDAVLGILQVAHRAEVSERYLLAGQNLTYRAAFGIVCDVVGRPPPRFALPPWLVPLLAAAVGAARVILNGRIPFDANQVRLSGRRLYVDGSKARQELGLRPRPFRQAVQAAYDWYRENGYLDSS
ncbi:MAG: NAD-dependent epimerase/dehydratase family protein [Candidatus Promineifilaceae bacterium]|nr:NAD-dependent epimerase/dehydratase family protein [Candidatus Promineifilaceae bacterium]